MLQVENCDVTFSFNKASIADPTIPPWTLKVKGQSYYVWHVESNAKWSTKETPSNEHTKGSLKFKRCNLTIDDEGQAMICSCQNDTSSSLAYRPISDSEDK